ncbi:hypothetical protein HYN43_010330 [Mucilaginibacter celer]|uniref:Nucleotidyl transferase AbiEii/AbiGii toxin family protein n=2 Tax=Mucilaginibacter celer TaxID=2305508 RepID=A0A494VPB0_9SPHI|nr:hypothetical protein HYN43_010330 [Mucilaginibacter celer]
MPFMLKGSYVTRQYLPDGVERFPADMDWVYMLHLQKEKEAERIFSDWVTNITELKIDDGITFRSFTEDRFWRLMDYAMADDFPTVNTDIVCTVHGFEIGLRVDISFNLPIEQQPATLTYQPIEGEAFVVPFTVPLSLQVSWKIHQTLVRERFKDLFDLTYLVNHPAFNSEVRTQTLIALVNECKTDNVHHEKLISFFNYEFEKLYPFVSIKADWDFWRHGIETTNKIKFSAWDEMAENITNTDFIPAQLPDFFQNLKGSMETAGLTPALLNQPPISDYISRSQSLAAISRELNKTNYDTRTTSFSAHQKTNANNKSALKRLITWLFKNE